MTGDFDAYSGMDVVIFCGGRGTRLSEKTHDMPKPLIELGEYPILWHIMKIYSHYGHSHFVLTLGYKGEMISDYFVHRYPLARSFDLNLGDIQVPKPPEPWNISFVQTGLKTKTATRLDIAGEHITTYPFLLTYGDGVADINIPALCARHEYLRKKFDVAATVTITRPYTKYGIVDFDESGLIRTFKEKPLMDQYINAGFMVVERDVFKYLDKGDVMFEDTLKDIAEDGRLGYYIHDGFWHAMDTYKDYEDLNRMWREDPPWKIWK